MNIEKLIAGSIVFTASAVTILPMGVANAETIIKDPELCVIAAGCNPEVAVLPELRDPARRLPQKEIDNLLAQACTRTVKGVQMCESAISGEWFPMLKPDGTKNAVIDHIVEHSAGGATTVKNSQVVSTAENLAKGGPRLSPAVAAAERSWIRSKLGLLSGPKGGAIVAGTVESVLQGINLWNEHRKGQLSAGDVGNAGKEVAIAGGCGYVSTSVGLQAGAATSAVATPLVGVPVGFAASAATYMGCSWGVHKLIDVVSFW